jgi:hypothetical protein
MSTSVEQGNAAAPSHRTKNPHTLRCFAYQQKSNLFVAECIDLDLMVKAKSMHGAIESLNDAIAGYLAVAYAGDVKGLIPRPAPLDRRLLYYWSAVQSLFSRFVHNGISRTAPRRFEYPDCHATS